MTKFATKTCAEFAACRADPDCSSNLCENTFFAVRLWSARAPPVERNNWNRAAITIPHVSTATTGNELLVEQFQKGMCTGDDL